MVVKRSWIRIPLTAPCASNMRWSLGTSILLSKYIVSVQRHNIYEPDELLYIFGVSLPHNKKAYICRCGGIGRHRGLKIPRVYLVPVQVWSAVPSTIGVVACSFKKEMITSSGEVIFLSPIRRALYSDRV